MNHYSIMIVDDEPHVTRILRMMLEREGYQVSCANDGHEALALMETQVPDVLITDIQMAGMDGRALCHAARLRYPLHRFPIMVMTSMTALSERTWARELADTEFLEKPLSPRQLVARLARHFTDLEQAQAPLAIQAREQAHVA